jgi:hypothetical protein
MSYYSGKDGILTYNGTQVAKVSTWSVSSTVETLDVTDLSLGDRAYVPGFRSITGSATIFYYDEAAVPLLGRIIKTASVGESDILAIKLGWGSKFIQGNCIITSGELSCAVGEIMQATIQFQFTGAPTSVGL